MGERSLDIMEAGTLRRKLKNPAIPDTGAGDDSNLGHLPGRVISSGPVVRVKSALQAKRKHKQPS